MNTNKLKNIFLGIIAINLTFITLIQLEFFPQKAYANETKQPTNTNFGLVPLNDDGSIDVNLVESSSVYIKGWIRADGIKQSLTLTKQGIPVTNM